VSASLAAFSFSLSSRWPICASSSWRDRLSRCLTTSSCVWRTDTSASASISARFFLLVAMISASLRRPIALKALLSSSAAKAAWSSRVSDTDSSWMPLRARLSCTDSRMLRTNSPRRSCSESIVSAAAVAWMASMKRPSSRLRTPSGLSDLAPIACAAVATPSIVGCTRR
jgi:hypothetical protein